MRADDAGPKHRMLLAGLLALVLGGCAQNKRPPVAFERETWKFAKRDGTRLVTPHYEIYTTLRDETLINALPDFVEASYEFYQNLVPAGQRADERMRVYLFSARPEWEAFTRSYTGQRSDIFLKIRNGGYSEGGVSVIQYVAHQVTFPLFAHEGFHQYVHFHLNRDIPAWLNEGLAVYSEGQRWGSDDRLKKFDPWFNPMRRNALAEAIIADRLHPLAKLLRTHAGEVINESSREVSSYYAQVWALVLFLREGQAGKYAADFQRLLDSLDAEDLSRVALAGAITTTAGDSSLGEALFRTFISNDLDQVEREYKIFVSEKFIGHD